MTFIDNSMFLNYYLKLDRLLLGYDLKTGPRLFKLFLALRYTFRQLSLEDIGLSPYYF
jgi:hypothetical protein